MMGLGQHPRSGPDYLAVVNSRWEYRKGNIVYSPIGDDWVELDGFPPFDDASHWETRPATSQDVIWGDMPQIFRCYMCGEVAFDVLSTKCPSCGDEISMENKSDSFWTDEEVQKALEFLSLGLRS